MPCDKNSGAYKCIGVRVLKSSGAAFAAITNIKMWGLQTQGGNLWLFIALGVVFRGVYRLDTNQTR